MYNIVLRIVCVCGLAVLMASCQSSAPGLDKTVDKLIKTGGDALKFMNTLSIIQRDFENGRIMRARARVLAMDAAHQDYAQAHRFLKQTIEPARRRLFVHYLRAAKQHEHQQSWAAAMWAYDQAKAVTIKPAKMEAKRVQMEIKMRQYRFDTLLQLRRKEDARLLQGAYAYAAPKGISPDDEVYGRLREHYNHHLNERARIAFREAKRFLRKDLPEIAYIEIESYIRLQPGMAQGVKKMHEIKRKMPVGLSISGLPKAGTKQIVAPQHFRASDGLISKGVTAKMIEAAMRSNEMILARQLAQVYRRQGGDGAEKLWSQVQNKAQNQAALLFAKGSDAFAKENLQQAIVYWRAAVALQPEKSEYTEALHRARQLQERLNLLRDKKFEHQPIGLSVEER